MAPSIDSSSEKRPSIPATYDLIVTAVLVAAALAFITALIKSFNGLL